MVLSAFYFGLRYFANFDDIQHCIQHVQVTDFCWFPMLWLLQGVGKHQHTESMDTAGNRLGENQYRKTSLFLNNRYGVWQ